MPYESRSPEDPLEFIRARVKEGQVFWTYHVNMRMKNRFIPRDAILHAVTSYEIIESYPEDKYLPSYLTFLRYEGQVYHVLFAVDLEHCNVRVVTAYSPNTDEWLDDLKRRRSS